MMGYEQTYLSAIEVGVKGPPNDEFINKLIQVLELSEGEQEALWEKVEHSQRRYLVPAEVTQEVYLMVHSLFSQIDRLHPSQIAIIDQTLRMPLDRTSLGKSIPLRIKRKGKEVEKMQKSKP